MRAVQHEPGVPNVSVSVILATVGLEASRANLAEGRAAPKGGQNGSIRDWLGVACQNLPNGAVSERHSSATLSFNTGPMRAGGISEMIPGSAALRRYSAAIA